MRESMTIIVPDETENLKDYHRVLDPTCSRHGSAIFLFCHQNNITSPLQEKLVQEDNYNGYIWSRLMAERGYLVIQETLTHKVFYLPPTITEHQYSWMKRHKSYFNRYRSITCFYSYSNDHGHFQEELYDQVTTPEEECFVLLYDLVKEKYNGSKRLIKK